MTLGPRERPPLGRREVLRRLLAAGAGTLLLGGLRVQDIGSVSAAPAVPPEPPGAPPAKQTASGITVPADDPALTANMAEYPGITPLMGYLSAPKGVEVYPGVLILHDRHGLTEHFKDITRRLAKAGYVGLAPDLLSRAGGTEKLRDLSKIQAALLGAASFQLLQDMNASVRYLEAHPLVAKNRIGAIGFGLGGGLLWFLLTQTSDIKAAVQFSATVPQPGSVSRVTAAVLMIFGESERQDTTEVSKFDAAMKKAGLPWAFKSEPKAGREFFDDTQKDYNSDAAQDAWKLTLDWFGKYLVG